MTVTAAQLRKLVEVPDDKADLDLQPFLASAALIRSEDLAGSGLSSNRLDQIELYLAAHFAVVSLEFGGVVMSKQGGSSETYRAPEAKATGLATTRFGQLALSLDTSGTLQKSMSTAKANFSVVRSVQPPCLIPPQDRFLD